MDRVGVNPEGRLFDPALGGGALLDVGIYTVRSHQNRSALVARDSAHHMGQPRS